MDWKSTGLFDQPFSQEMKRETNRVIKKETTRAKENRFVRRQRGWLSSEDEERGMVLRSVCQIENHLQSGGGAGHTGECQGAGKGGEIELRAKSLRRGSRTARIRRRNQIKNISGHVWSRESLENRKKSQSRKGMTIVRSW